MSGHGPCMTRNCHLTTGFPLDFPFMSFSRVPCCPGPVCPVHAVQPPPFHVPDIVPCMSRSFVASHFPTSPVVPIGFLVRCFPFLPPALPLFSFLSLACPFQFPLVSLSCPAAFLSCRLPISSPHFLRSPIFAAKNTFFPRFRN